MGNIFVWYDSLNEWALHGDLFELLAEYTLLTNSTEVTETVNPLGRKVQVRSNDEKTARYKTRFQAGEVIYTKIDHQGIFRRKRLFYCCFYSKTAVLNINPLKQQFLISTLVKVTIQLI